MFTSRRREFGFSAICLLVFIIFAARDSECRDKKEAVQYGAGLIVNVPEPQADVVRAVQEVVQNGIIRGSKEYSKDEYISGAAPASESRLFPPWTEGGEVFYKVRVHALDPLNFKDSGDMGTLAVRYIVMGQDDKHTVLKIDALFAEDFRHTVHSSNGSVEGAEYKVVHDLLETADAMKQETVQAEQQKQQAALQKQISVSGPALPALPQSAVEKPDSTPQPVAAAPTGLEDRVKDLRHQVQRRVKSPGTALKAAPYQSATNLQLLSSGTEVLVVIITSYWFGVETHEGQHGWIPRDQLEELP
ncbi:MAG TPA: hypothetical protein VHW45_18200 [Candidatus Sulfotelmatobacter sp.]|nr:hypothetical protein [Candidatus Sulfotelmatobacter sp.]